MTVHRYAARCSWSGSTDAGYEAYDRGHVVTAPPAEAELRLSSDPAFRGDGRRLNPEQLFVAAVSSCQLLEFLALAARARVGVVSYEDEAEGTMDDAADPAWIERIVLRPRIAAPGASVERVRKLVDQAHRLCFIANSVRTEIVVDARIDV